MQIDVKFIYFSKYAPSFANAAFDSESHLVLLISLLLSQAFGLLIASFSVAFDSAIHFTYLACFVIQRFILISFDLV